MQSFKTTLALFVCTFFAICMLPTSGRAQMFPKGQLVDIQEVFPNGASAKGLYDFLAQKNFIIAEKKEKYWRRKNGSIYSFPTPKLKALLDGELCIPIDCVFYWAEMNQDPPILKSVIGHTYRIIWGVSDGKVVAIDTDHQLWHGVK
jgi:hypothetical protein